MEFKSKDSIIVCMINGTCVMNNVTCVMNNVTGFMNNVTCVMNNVTCVMNNVKGFMNNVTGFMNNVTCVMNKETCVIKNVTHFIFMIHVAGSMTVVFFSFLNHENLSLTSSTLCKLKMNFFGGKKLHLCQLFCSKNLLLKHCSNFFHDPVTCNSHYLYNYYMYLTMHQTVAIILYINIPDYFRYSKCHRFTKAAVKGHLCRKNK